MTNSDVINPSLAALLAKEYHKGQDYKLGDPTDPDNYFKVHLTRVAMLTQSLIETNHAISVAWLHDILEDTSIEENYLHELAGTAVFNDVKLLTDKQGRNRRERHIRTYPAIRTSDIATAVKLADRIVNRRNSIELSDKTGDKSFGDMYDDEFPYFFMMLYSPDHKINRPLWNMALQTHMMSKEDFSLYRSIINQEDYK